MPYPSASASQFFSKGKIGNPEFLLTNQALKPRLAV